ncbi:MAG TPA: DUF2871 domain-containing protein [Candidatus Merdivicinus intestinigallinarum]|nr:DUF2871 domain-containing protein [Candidatus Merdivicinus intestinigallinarum]
MYRKYLSTAFIYAVIAMVWGVFYREFTKFAGFSGETALSVIHVHYFALGMIFFLLLALLEKNFAFSGGKGVKPGLVFYHAGLNIAWLGFFLRGLVQASETVLSKGMDAAISGVSGLGHICLAAGMLLLLWRVRSGASASEK